MLLASCSRNPDTYREKPADIVCYFKGFATCLPGRRSGCMKIIARPPNLGYLFFALLYCQVVYFAVFPWYFKNTVNNAG